MNTLKSKDNQLENDSNTIIALKNDVKNALQSVKYTFYIVTYQIN
jgi:hypothetical protein